MSASTPQAAKRVRLLVVDDHPIFRAGLCEELGGEDGFEIVGQASDGEQSCKLVAELRPEIVLMDAQMPGMQGLEATRLIKHDFPQTKIIMLSATADSDSVRTAIRAGANGYILKTASTADLRQAILSVMGGTSVFTSSITQASTAPDAPNSFGLSKREIEILEYAARGITNKSIGEQLNLSNRTIEVHMHNIFMKLGVSSRTEAVTKALRDRSIQLP